MKKGEITFGELTEWIDKHGEDIITDGPFRLTEKDKQKFIDRINDNTDIIRYLSDMGYIRKHSVYDFKELRLLAWHSKCDEILEEFVEFLNDEEIEITK